MSSIFISHSNKDNAFAIELRQRLAEQGYQSLFLDFDPEVGIPAGQNWEKKLYEKLRNCQAIIILCSEYSMCSPWCLAEITIARFLGKFIFPIKISPCNIEHLIKDLQVPDITKGKEEAYQRLWLGFQVVGLDPKNLVNWDNSRPPYPGLNAFKEEDSIIFFGREKDRDEVLSEIYRLRTSGKPLLLLLGVSGSGKSSLVQAGIVPRIKRNYSWIIVGPFRPFKDPFSELAKALDDCFSRYHIQRPWKDILRKFQEIGDADEPNILPWLNFASELRQAAGQFEATILLVIDQVEEILGYPSEALASRFLHFLRTALEIQDSPYKAIGTLRSDALGTFQEQPELQGMAFNNLSIGHMGLKEMAQTIEGPAQVAGIELEIGLVSEMIRDTETDNALPLLAFTLRELWEIDSHCLRLETYNSLGKLEGSVAKVAQDTLDRHTPAIARNRKIVEKSLFTAFLKMVKIDDEEKFSRQSVRRNELSDDIQEILKHFIEARLLVVPEQAIDSIDVRHEALFRTWPQLNDWLEKNREFLRWRKRLNEAFQAWEYLKDEGSLLRGKQLRQAQEFIQKRREDLRSEEEDFIQRSIDNYRRDNRRKRSLEFSLIITIILAIFIGVISLFQWQKNQKNQIIDRIIYDNYIPEDISILTDILSKNLQKASQYLKSNKIDKSLDEYRRVRLVIHKLFQQVESNQSSQISREIQQNYQDIYQKASKKIINIIYEYRFAKLKYQLKEGEIGEIYSGSPGDLDQQFTSGAIQTTYQILMREFGLYADFNNDGYLQSKEADIIPCDILELIEEIWRKFTRNRCSWYGSDSYFDNFDCTELLISNEELITDSITGATRKHITKFGGTLLISIFQDSSDVATKRINSCDFVSKPIAEE